MNIQPSSPVPLNQPTPFNRQSPKTVRNIGWVLILFGSGLSVAMAASAFYLSNTIVFNKQSGPHSHWNGGPEFTRTTFELFGSIFLLGILSVTGGGYQVSTGRRHPVLVALVFPVAGAVAYFGYCIISAPHPAL